MSRKLVNVLLLVALVLLFGVSFIIGGQNTDSEERFAGADGAATEQIKEYAPEYKQWFEPFFQPESSEVESGLFALQAGLGGTVLGFAIGGLWGRRRATLEAAAAAKAQADRAPSQPEL